MSFVFQMAKRFLRLTETNLDKLTSRKTTRLRDNDKFFNGCLRQ